MLDDQNRQLAEFTKADGFIVSDRLISLLLAQISENSALTDVFGNCSTRKGQRYISNRRTTMYNYVDKLTSTPS